MIITAFSFKSEPTGRLHNTLMSSGYREVCGLGHVGIVWAKEEDQIRAFSRSSVENSEIGKAAGDFAVFSSWASLISEAPTVLKLWDGKIPVVVRVCALPSLRYVGQSRVRVFLSDESGSVLREDPIMSVNSRYATAEDVEMFVKSVRKWKLINPRT